MEEQNLETKLPENPPEQKVEETVEESCENSQNKCDELEKVQLDLAKSQSCAENKNEPTNDDDSVNAKSKDNATEPASTSTYKTENITYEGSVAVYTDPESGYQYQWNADKNEWVPKSNATYGFEDDTHTYTDAEGIKYFWDKEKSAWFPKVDDLFIAQYQMNYGFVNNTTNSNNDASSDTSAEVKKPGEKRKPSTPTWFEVDDQQNNKVYVSNLPLDITEEEFVETMQKCGLVMRDPTSGKMKVKLYTDKNNPEQLKGDGLCTYIKIESVDLALKLLDGYDLRGQKIKVERAKFQMKGSEYDPRLKPKKRKKKELDKIKRMQEKLFDWRPEKMRGERSKHEKVVIVKNLFEPSLFDKEVSLILEYQQDLRDECTKCGEVRRVVIYDRHPEGVAQITMREPEEADQVVILLNNRWFGQRQITAEIWDGKTKYKIAETDSEISKRLENWEKFVDGAADQSANEKMKLVHSNKDDKLKDPTID